MPKMKSNRSALKRVKQTGKGRFKVRRANRNHILTKNTTKIKRQRRGIDVVGLVNQRLLQKVVKLFRKARGA
jgi:ribosomal protein L35